LSVINLEIGKTVGDYEIIALLGRGGMGRVFKVRNLISDRVEAMKSLLYYADAEPELAERFLREIKVLAKLEHPNITSFRTAFRINNELLMIMEHVEGNSLEQKLTAGTVEPWRAVHYASQVLDGLGHAHRCGVLHRDVKPSNILIGPGDQIKLTDFGIASLTGDPGLTMTGRTTGTLCYMSPEQMKAEALDSRSDLYSVGVTLYEMLTGEPPFKGESYYVILRAHLEDKVVPPIERVPDLAPALSRLIEKSLEKQPADRFQSAEEFRLALQGLNLPKPSDSNSLAAAAIDASTYPAAFKTPPRGSQASPWDPVVLETARKNLAVYIGPMAKVIVGRAANHAHSIKELYQILATEIASLHDREKFLRSTPL
jgi:eukaryotic-like serine/threonine-protein kinase